METAFYIISIVILVIPLFWTLKHEGKFRLTWAGIVFTVFVLSSVLLNVKIYHYNKKQNVENKRTIDTLIQKIDSLRFVVAYQLDSILIMQDNLQNTININDSITNVNTQLKRPLVKIFEANALDNGITELKIVNDGITGATNIKGVYAFIVKSLINNADNKVTQKELPFLPSDILTNRDDFIRINIPSGIFDWRKYIDEDWIYLIINLSYTDILGKKTYPYETTMRLRRIDNGKYNGAYNYEHNHYMNFIK